MLKCALVGEAWGANEEIVGAGLVGPSGVLMLRMLDEASIISLTQIDNEYIREFWQTNDPHKLDAVWNMHPEIARTNVFNFHPPSNDLAHVCGPKKEAIPGYPILIKPGKYVRAEFAPELDRLGDELLEWNPNLIIAMGNTATWALMGKTTISKLRGYIETSTYTVEGFKVLPIYHPAAVLRDYSLRPWTVLDLMKANKEKEFPDVVRPQREIWINPEIGDLYAFDDLYIRHAEYLSVDIETAGKSITRIGMAPSHNRAIVIPFTDRRRLGNSYWPSAALERQAWDFIRDIMSRPRPKKVFQNGMYDIAFTLRSYGIRTIGADEDTMLLHHALQPEALKGLGFLGSAYINETAWKGMRERVTTIKRDE